MKAIAPYLALGVWIFLLGWTARLVLESRIPLLAAIAVALVNLLFYENLKREINNKIEP